MNYKIMADKVLVKLHKPEERSKSGLIIIPKEAQKTSSFATVIAIGPRQENVKPGDVVVISSYVGIEVVIDDVDYIILDDFEIMGIVEDTTIDEDHNHQYEVVSTVIYFECVCCGKTYKKVVDAEHIQEVVNG